MTADRRSKLRRLATWALLCVNFIVLVFLSRQWLSYAKPATASARKAAEMLGMKTYCVRDPFVLLVNKEFPANSSFTLLVDDQSLVMSAEEVAQHAAEATRREVTVILGIEFSITCEYSLVQGVPKVHEIVISKEDGALFDLNADGFSDERIPNRTVHKGPGQIWYQGEWRDLDPQGEWSNRYEKRLRDGTLVRFDMESGRWLSQSDKANSQEESQQQPEEPVFPKRPPHNSGSRQQWCAACCIVTLLRGKEGRGTFYFFRLNQRGRESLFLSTWCDVCSS